jgi:hypothetical protein
MKAAKGFALLVCFGGLFSLAGCSRNKPMPKELGPVMPVQGAVYVEGKLLKGGNVTFFPLDHDPNICQPLGIIDSQGNYFVSSYGKKGAPAGKYRVTVEAGSDDKKLDMMVDGRYLNPEKTPLTITVQENAPAGAYDLKLKSARKKR